MSTTKKSRARNRDSINPIYHYPKEPYPCEEEEEEEEEVETKSERVIPETSCPMECQLCSYSPFPLASVAISLAVRFLPWKSAHLLHRYN